ncbi:hypothetical protein E4U22_002577 [Claviceps purpurea]|nr:hypothetical protein E4U51_002631 [Claviceps purpurea]KAG6320959.1 hypothetical protein E4U22_002577 [Claviceps purpurea]
MNPWSEIAFQPKLLMEEDAACTQDSYYDRRYRQGPALVRARRPYVFKTAALGVALAGLSFSIYWYTLKAIGQDSFDDVKVPDEPRKPIENKK